MMVLIGLTSTHRLRFFIFMVLIGLAGAAACQQHKISRGGSATIPNINQRKQHLLLHPTTERIFNRDPHHWVLHLTQHNRDNDDGSADLEEDCFSVLPSPTPAKPNRHLTSCFNTDALLRARAHHRKAAIFSWLKKIHPLVTECPCSDSFKIMLF